MAEANEQIINHRDQLLLDIGARAIASGDPAPEVSLSEIPANVFMMPGVVAEFFAERVERLTDGQRTVREADPALVDRVVMGAFSYMVVCDPSVPKEKVTKMTDGMRLVGAGPYRNGFKFDIEQTSDEDRQLRLSRRRSGSQ